MSADKRIRFLMPNLRRYPRRPITKRFKPIRMEPRPTAYADWYCEGDAIGHPSRCSPGNAIHSPAHCGWMS
jgi:hypothetical protein